MRYLLKRVLPPSIVHGLSFIEEGICQRLYRPSHMIIVWRDLQRSEGDGALDEESRIVFRQALLDWLCRAQDATGVGGVSGYYSFSHGWSAAYPETTGYIIPTFLEAARRCKMSEYQERARRMADWEVSIQLADGSWQSGFVTAPKVPAVFNTGQVIEGLVAAHSWFGDSRYLEAAARGGDWLVKHQDEDGGWRQFTYRNMSNTYFTRVAWPLLALAKVTGEVSYRHSAVRFLEWAARCQHDTGWFEHCALEPNEPPLTHTIGYTIEGFLESGLLLKEDRWITVGQRAADALLHRYEVRRRLAGTYAEGWKGDHSFSCLTGCAQISRVWNRLYEITRDTRYLNAALKLNDFVIARVDLRSGNAGLRGGVSGSYPVWGPYMSYRVPNWAAKFTLDALFAEEDAMAMFRSLYNDHRHSVRIPQ
jgi:hypothetical protein